MTINLFDDKSWLSLRPLTFTRPVANLRIGILTIAEKWAKYLHADFGYLTQAYLSSKYPAIDSALYINGSICPDEALLNAITALQDGEALVKNELVIAYFSSVPLSASKALTQLKPIAFTGDFTHLVYPEQLFGFNPIEIRKDFALLTKGRTSAQLDSTNTILGDHIFVEEGAKATCSIFNTTYGPIYLGKNSEVWEASAIRGSFALGENASVKMGAKIYSGTTIGPNCRVGGEINNSVIWGNSSKGHEGYLGNSVMGEWCNIGADSNNSNLKNNYANVKLYDYETQKMRDTTLQFCGLIMADHAKCGINTMFNTGSVVGVSANVFGAGFPPHHIPDFSWGGAQGFETYRLDKMLQTTIKVLARKQEVLNEADRAILAHIFEITEQYRGV